MDRKTLQVAGHHDHGPAGFWISDCTNEEVPVDRSWVYEVPQLQVNFQLHELSSSKTLVTHVLTCVRLSCDIDPTLDATHLSMGMLGVSSFMDLLETTDHTDECCGNYDISPLLICHAGCQ